MQKRMLVTNCPNCAGELAKDGKCPYCGTHVRMANELDIDATNWWGSDTVSIQINIKRGDETIILPVRGQIGSLTINHSPHSYPEVEFDFYGSVISLE